MNKMNKDIFKDFVHTLAGDVKHIEEDIKNGDKFTGFDPEFDKIRMEIWNWELKLAKYCKEKTETHNRGK